MKTTLSRAAALAAAAALSTAALTACDVSSTEGLSGGSSSSPKDNGSSSDSANGVSSSTPGDKDKTPKSSEAPAPTEAPAKDVRGCEANEDNAETPIAEDQDLGPISISAVYFQPGQMMQPSKMLNYDKAAAHLEVDTKITEKGAEWGYTKGETPANMDIKYIIRDADKKIVNQGMLMEMNAGDGSHYGTNLPEGVMKDGKYTVQFVIGQPKNYALHKDLVTGVPANGWWDTITTDEYNWDYKTPVKSANPVRDCDVPAYQPVATPKDSENPDAKPVLNPKSDWMTPGKGKCSDVEINVGGADAAPFSIDVNYFQPGGMMNQWLGKKTLMNRYEDSLMHLEADIKMVDGEGDLPVGAKATDYGYSDDETPAGLHVAYSILDKSGKEVDKGMFMEMNADDGSHYGTNISNKVQMTPGDYTLVLKISHPTDYSLHIDNKTGVAARHWYKDFEVKLPWKYTGAQTVCQVTPWQDAFPQPVPGDKK